MKRYVFVLFLFISPAFAQDQKSLNLSVTVPEAQALLTALSQGPWRDVNPLMQKLIVQVNSQMIPAPPSNPPAEVKPSPDGGLLEK